MDIQQIKSLMALKADELSDELNELWEKFIQQELNKMRKKWPGHKLRACQMHCCFWIEISPPIGKYHQEWQDIRYIPEDLISEQVEELIEWYHGLNTEWAELEWNVATYDGMKVESE